MLPAEDAWQLLQFMQALSPQDMARHFPGIYPASSASAPA
ncbi:hypothetical protein SAMN05421881_100737 [Nitrosomonas halophila]|jgi:hypothetical protein|uniref:Uncharacterized protein n=1 Tax=Nitrosomonas halophila TaxID=44576 RepID=A0A1H3E6N9_9PROT|nr:hypothetical protein SAMN05421881_100737 [Nitrosomonas halophila]